MVKLSAAPVLLICSACATGSAAPAVYLKSRVAGVMERSGVAVCARPAHQSAIKTVCRSRPDCFARLIPALHRQHGGETTYGHQIASKGKQETKWRKTLNKAPEPETMGIELFMGCLVALTISGTNSHRFAKTKFIFRFLSAAYSLPPANSFFWTAILKPERA